jgi:long-chain fatty acid transport protein
MKKIISLSLVSAIALFATNGDNLIGLGAKSRAMGGVGIATYFGAENALSNPALISNSKGGEVDFGATYFAPTIKTNDAKSKADKNVIPEVSVSEKINDSFAYGIGMYGSAGMGVDFRDSSNPSLMKARTNLLLMKFAPAIAYHKSNFAFGFAPVIQYGSLNIAYNNGTQVGSGSSDDFGLGFEAGLTYDINSMIRVGAVYKTAISMTYKHELSTAAQGFGMVMSDKLEQPAVYGLGLSYNFSNYNISFDYKKIKWASADGYKDFGWKDQDVYAIGAKYEKDGTWYGIGYNYAKNPITNYTTTGGDTNAKLNSFNYIMFPATEESHYSIGAGTKITKHLSLDFDVIYAPEKTVSATGYGGGNITVKHSETSAAFSMRYNF